MGVRIGPLLKEIGLGQEIDYVYLEGKIIAIDALPTLYEMLTTIRDNKGKPLRDSRGRVTSHLVGLFNRTCRMLALGIKPVFVFDGPPHPLKSKTLEIRQQRKMIAKEKMEKAILVGDYAEAKKYAKQSVVIDEHILASSVKLLELLGVPIVKAVHDGEAQAAYMVKKGDAFAVSSPDYDSFLFGSPRVIRNLKMSLQKKEKPVLYELNDLLKALKLTQEQLVDMAILIGTDYNPEGIEGIGPKKAFELIKKYGSLENIVEKRIVKFKDPVDPLEIKNIFLNPEVNDEYRIEFNEPDYNGVVSLLVDEFDFNRDRVEKELNDVKRRLEREKKGGIQTSLDRFFSS